jgi:hypothetical protein
MKAFTTSIAVIFGLGLTACGTAFGIASGDDAGMDAPAADDAGIGDGATRNDSPTDAFRADQRVDGAVGDESRRDVASTDVGHDGAEDVPRDAVRSDGVPADGGRSDGAPSIDVLVDVGRVDTPLFDALIGDGSGTDARCVAETDQAFCVRLGKTCEMVTGADNCGAMRNANCGSCAIGMGCVDGVCKVPVCSSFSYAAAVYPPFSVAGTSDFAIATSAQGESILYAQSPVVDCSTAATYLADEVTPGSRTYTSRLIAPWLDSNKATAQALSGDGLTLIVELNDFKTFQSARRSALQVIDFHAPSSADFTAVNGMLAGTAGLFRGGVISADGLEFYFTIFNDPATDGIYRAKRLAVSSPFSAGVRVTGIDPSYTDVTGISSDRLALFVFKAWAGGVFTRSSTTAEFSNPYAPNPPPELAGWHHKPFADCATLVATMSLGGGCANQDIFFQTRQ